jgi:hypothetical protein
MLDNKFVTIDNIYHRQISEGCVLCIYGDYYLSSYWYVYEKDKNNLLTIIQLDTYYKPKMNPSKILKVNVKDIDYMIISNPKSKLNFIKTEVNIPIDFFKNYNYNRLNYKLPKYGDILLVEQTFFSYGVFFVLNYEPHNYSYLIYNINKCKTESIFIELCNYKTITTKELRRQIYDKSEIIRIKHKNTNYQILNEIDQRIFFQTKMNYMFDSGINNACIGLMQLGFLDQPLINLTNKINEELNIIEEKNNEALELLNNYESISEELEYNYENKDDENFIKKYLTDYKYSESNQITEKTEDESSISNYDNNKSSSEGDTIDYPECSYDDKYYNYIEDYEQKYDSYNEDSEYNQDEVDDNYYNHAEYIENIYENNRDEKVNLYSNDCNIGYLEQQYLSNAFDSYEENKYMEQSNNNSENKTNNNYDDQLEKDNYDDNLDSKVDELYDYYNTFEQKLVIDEEIINTISDSIKFLQNEYDEMPALIKIDDYSNKSINDDKEIKELINLFNNCKLIDIHEIITNNSLPVKLESDQEIIINNSMIIEATNTIHNDNLIIESETIPENTDDFVNETIPKNTDDLITETIIENTDDLVIETITENTDDLVAETIPKNTDDLITETITENTDDLITETIPKNTDDLITETITENTNDLFINTQNIETIDDYVTITRDEIEPISRESCSIM